MCVFINKCMCVCMNVCMYVCLYVHAYHNILHHMTSHHTIPYHAAIDYLYIPPEPADAPPPCPIYTHTRETRKYIIDM